MRWYVIILFRVEDIIHICSALKRNKTERHGYLKKSLSIIVCNHHLRFISVLSILWKGAVSGELKSFFNTGESLQDQR